MMKSKNKKDAQINISAELCSGPAEMPDHWKYELTNIILEYSHSKSSLKKFPSFVKTHLTKPKLYLDDGDVLFCFAVSFVRGVRPQIGVTKYGGSYDSIFMHQKEQLSEGFEAPDNMIGVFITEHAPSGSGNRIWSVDLLVGKYSKISWEVNKELEK